MQIENTSKAISIIIPLSPFSFSSFQIAANRSNLVFLGELSMFGVVHQLLRLLHECVPNVLPWKMHSHICMILSQPQLLIRILGNFSQLPDFWPLSKIFTSNSLLALQHFDLASSNVYLPAIIVLTFNLTPTHTHGVMCGISAAVVNIPTRLNYSNWLVSITMNRTNKTWKHLNFWHLCEQNNCCKRSK